MKIVFMGTPDFAVKSLAEIAKVHEVAAVFTQTDKPVGRKQILTPPPVKVLAESLNIPVYQPPTLKDGKALDILKQISPDLIAVVAYGKILPKKILELPKYGCVNVHGSLLPKYRGASPIQWCIVSGDTVTGVTTMKMDEGMDTGDILETEETAIGEDETAGELFERLADIGAKLLVKTVKDLENGDVVPRKQQEDGVSKAPIIKKEMAKLDFSLNAKELCCAVRGYNPWPCAYFISDGKRIKVYKAKISEMSGKPGTVLKADSSLIIACGNGALELTEVQPEGKKRMSASDMLRGSFKLKVGDIVN